MQKDVSLTIGFLIAPEFLTRCSQTLALHAEGHRTESEPPPFTWQVGHAGTEGLAPRVTQPGSQDPRTRWKNPDNRVCQDLPRCLWPERASVWMGPVQEPELLAMAAGCETSLFLSSPGGEGRGRTLQIPSQTEPDINQ